MILEHEAEARSFRPSGAGWIKDLGAVVAEIKLVSEKRGKRRYACYLGLYVKLHEIPSEYTELLKEFTPRMITIYLPPSRAPDGKSHLLKVVNATQLGPGKHIDLEETVRVNRALTLNVDGTLDKEQEKVARDIIVDMGFTRLLTCSTVDELADRCRRGAPPFGIFTRYADKYLLSDGSRNSGRRDSWDTVS
jgi:hypothetical protein